MYFSLNLLLSSISCVATIQFLSTILQIASSTYTPFSVLICLIPLDFMIDNASLASLLHMEDTKMPKNLAALPCL